MSEGLWAEALILAQEGKNRFPESQRGSILTEGRAADLEARAAKQGWEFLSPWGRGC